MYVPGVTAPLTCPVCGAKLGPGPYVTCAQCGSELDFDNAAGPVVKRGETSVGKKIVEVVTSRFLAEKKVDLAADALAMQRLAEASERAAREIAEKGKTTVDLPFITAGPSGPLNLKMKIRKDDLQ